ncbi:6848_t:CDS:2, partial [Gigaspora margarita]
TKSMKKIYVNSSSQDNSKEKRNSKSIDIENNNGRNVDVICKANIDEEKVRDSPEPNKDENKIVELSEFGSND